MTLPLVLTIEQDYPAYAPYPLLSPLLDFADDTNLTVAHTRQEPHSPDDRPTVTQQANELLGVTISYLSRNNLIVQPTKSVAMIKGSTTAPTLGPRGPRMHVVEATTHLGVIQTTNPRIPASLPTCNHTWPISPDMLPRPPRPPPYPTKAWHTNSRGS